ncbi:MAG: hypothetical protein ACP5O5_01300 [Fervidicoccaceae archaeon]
MNGNRIGYFKFKFKKEYSKYPVVVILRSRPRDFQTIMTERQKIYEKIEEVLETRGGEEAERRLIALLERGSRVRREMVLFIRDYSSQVTSEEEKEYIKTILDFLRLVDSEREMELIERIIDLSLKSKGVLRERREWLLQQLEESRKLGSLSIAI